MSKAVAVLNEMPENCWECPFCYDYRDCLVSNEPADMDSDTRPEWCELQEITEGSMNGEKNTNSQCLYLTKNGRCEKWNPKCKCCQSDKDWLDDVAEVIEVGEMCEKSSLYGNDYIGITVGQLKAMLEGKVLHLDRERGVFIGLAFDVEIAGESKDD